MRIDLEAQLDTHLSNLSIEEIIAIWFALKELSNRPSTHDRNRILFVDSELEFDMSTVKNLEDKVRTQLAKIIQLKKMIQNH